MSYLETKLNERNKKMKKLLLVMCLMFFSGFVLAYESYDDYMVEVQKYNECLSSQNQSIYFGGGPIINCYEPVEYTGCNVYFGGGPECIPIKISSTSVYVAESKTLYILNADAIINRIVLKIPYVKLLYDEDVGGFLVKD